ncbi:MAG TPA: Rpn family recombination-promoting nuclease/putative transposase [Paenibacillus sp.]|uniref:Rpn family recombination-promoting nuclease/putative transposase n=1 Tax=Paenibacillus sp. TaxID=58172 RepID=UPI0028D4FF76|nr:Rpn family recombination-promoting nuclease/putative transposase [Paenibacillus sp.]HUC92100.1 Rpn family recombination-promoting nuclease/putative transposase [Paenibacillus sp.]
MLLSIRVLNALPQLSISPYSGAHSAIGGQLDDRLARWMTFISGASKEQWEELAMDMPGLKKAMTTLEFLSQDKEMRALYEMRKKAQLDEQSALDYAETRGEERGRTAVAMNLLRKGMSTAEIAEVTGFSEAEIEELKKQWH